MMKIPRIPAGGCCLTLIAAAGLVCAASLSKADKQFMITAAVANMTEAHEGQMAENQATQADVKDFGKALVQDHSESYARLSELAARTGVAIPKGINVAHDHTIQQLAHLKGDRFDRQFANDEIAAHRQAIALFQKEAAHGQDADLKAYATSTLPVLEKHLHLAEQCAGAAKRT